jgi:hypothetical protein
MQRLILEWARQHQALQEAVHEGACAGLPRGPPQ